MSHKKQNIIIKADVRKDYLQNQHIRFPCNKNAINSTVKRWPCFYELNEDLDRIFSKSEVLHVFDPV